MYYYSTSLLLVLPLLFPTPDGAATGFDLQETDFWRAAGHNRFPNTSVVVTAAATAPAIV
jgi:hypothetical protein